LPWLLPFNSAMLNSLAPMSFAPSWKDFFAKNGELTDKESIHAR